MAWTWLWLSSNQQTIKVIMSWNLSRTSQTLKISKGGNADMSLTWLMFSVGGKGVHCHERPQHRECGSWPGVLVSLHKHKRACGLDWIPHRSWPWQTAGKQIKTTDTHQPWQYALESLATFGQVQLCFLNWLGRRRPSNISTEECNLIRVSAIGFTNFVYWKMHWPLIWHACSNAGAIWCDRREPLWWRCGGWCNSCRLANFHPCSLSIPKPFHSEPQSHTVFFFLPDQCNPSCPPDWFGAHSRQPLERGRPPRV